MWSQFRKKYVCTAEIISFSIGIIAGTFLWFIHPMLGVFGGFGIAFVLMGEKFIFWPKSLEQKTKESSIAQSRE